MTIGSRSLTQLKSNRLVSLDRTGNRPVGEVAIDERGTIVHLKDYSMINVFKIVASDGDIRYWATNDLATDDLSRLKYAEQSCIIENHDRGIKQFCGIDRAQVRSARAQPNHLQLALRTFLRPELHRLLIGVRWFEAKTDIIRHAVRAYLAYPLYILGATS